MNDKNSGLEKFGYKLENTLIRGDTLISNWIPSEKSKDFLGKFVATEVRGILINTKSFHKDGKLNTITNFENHVKIGRTFIPLSVKTQEFLKEYIREEIITFKDPKYSVNFPEWVTNFKIPNDVISKKVEW